MYKIYNKWCLNQNWNLKLCLVRDEQTKFVKQSANFFKLTNNLLQINKRNVVKL